MQQIVRKMFKALRFLISQIFRCETKKLPAAVAHTYHSCSSMPITWLHQEYSHAAEASLHLLGREHWTSSRNLSTRYSEENDAVLLIVVSVLRFKTGLNADHFLASFLSFFQHNSSSERMILNSKYETVRSIKFCSLRFVIRLWRAASVLNLRNCKCRWNACQSRLDKSIRWNLEDYKTKAPPFISPNGLTCFIEQRSDSDFPENVVARGISASESGDVILILLTEYKKKIIRQPREVSVRLIWCLEEGGQAKKCLARSCLAMV